ncbi:tetratricopeptide repeat protein [Psychroflexus aestuariivivens]|uniref:tetratricopeptide repeat protein n=1 Tax=Psychroflexus aestuariivivens TaxID=1795040 RepID=UPI000FD88644|nr:tetratricopeptide repeat protein [Psychroflexus aestuariivivens]
MKLKGIITIGILMIGAIIYAQEIKKDTVQKDGIKNNISTTKTGMYKGTKSKNAKALFQKALKFSEKQDFQNAEKYYLEALREDPKFVEAYDNLGRLYRRIGKYDKAISNYKKSIELYPNGIMAHQNIAVVYGIKEEYENAINEYKEIIKLSPDNPEGYFGLANSYMMVSKFDLALKNAEKTVEIYKQTDSHYLNEGYYLTGLIYYYSGNTEKAKENLLLAKENGANIDPNLENEIFSNHSDNDNIQLKTKEDYAKYESKVIEDINWIMNTPLKKDSQTRKEKSAFLIKWMSGSPTVSIELVSGIVPLGCADCLMSFMSGWTKYSLENDYSDNKVNCAIAGVEYAIEFYENNKSELGKNSDMEKLIKQQKREN